MKTCVVATYGRGVRLHCGLKLNGCGGRHEFDDTGEF